jgi:outer membrane protein assembly factor BamB
VSAFSARDGKQLYQERLGVGGHYYASLVSGGGLIYALSESGTLTIFPAADRLAIASRVAMKETARATPALADGIVYIRTEKHLWAIGSRK